MNKVLIPTKLSDVAANTLKTAGYEVIQDADTPLEKQVAAHPDAVALIVRSEKVTPEIMDAAVRCRISCRGLFLRTKLAKKAGIIRNFVVRC